ncbi:MAG: hypothetical protein AAF196_03630 [Planctomycetota bacterium]
MQNPLNRNHLYLRRKVLKILGAGFQLFDENDEQIGYSEQKAFKLKEDIRVKAGTSKDPSPELLTIKARQVVDFSACYDVVDTEEGRKIGALRRKGFASMARDSWQILDENDEQIGEIKEDSMTLALIRRFLASFIPQTFRVFVGGDEVARIKQRFNLFVYKLDATCDQPEKFDGRMLTASTILLAAIEGAQS